MKAIERLVEEISEGAGETPYLEVFDDALIIDGTVMNEQIIAMGDALAWIEIKDGCEMPNRGEEVIGAYIFNDKHHWDMLMFRDGEWMWLAHGEWEPMQYAPTHWRRVGLPK